MISWKFSNFYFYFPNVLEKKRRVYDQYGKEGLLSDRGHNRSSRYNAHEFDEFDIRSGFPFVFRPPEEVFREFFGGHSPFADLFGGKDIVWN